jgi:uncharacterized glyoxalase superfamily protein PhnB
MPQAKKGSIVLNYRAFFLVEPGAFDSAINQQDMTMQLSPAIPIIRIFEEDKAKEFYLEFLGFVLQWEHRFDVNFPLYAQLKRSELTLHLSEHHGDATPGSAVFVPMKNVDVFQQELIAKNYKYTKPAIQDLPWGRMMEVVDPFGNKIRFCELSD